MKTVKEIALELGVSQVTVYNHLKKNDKELKGNIFKKKGVTHLDDDGIRLIKISMGLIQAPVVRENISVENIIDNISSKVSKELLENIKVDYENLQEQVNELQEQNKLLIDLITKKNNKKSFLSWFKR